MALRSAHAHHRVAHFMRIKHARSLRVYNVRAVYVTSMMADGGSGRQR